MCPQILFGIPEDLDFSINKDENTSKLLAISGDCKTDEARPAKRIFDSKNRCKDVNKHPQLTLQFGASSSKNLLIMLK